MGSPDFGLSSDPALLILASLGGGPKHGYAMMQDIKAMTGLHLGPGTLYGALARLEARGWIVPLPSADRRRPYQLTSEGAATLRAQLAGLHDFATQGLARLAGDL